MSARGGSRVDSLDGLRTIAVLLVVAFHLRVPGFSGGYLGVDVFFVLSGFLITTLLLRELSATGRIDLGRFWARRALRLMPAVLLVILAVVVWATTLAPPFRRPSIGADALWSLLYVGNWRFIGSAGYFTDDGTSSPLLHVWSLAVEEQFYVVWPLLLGLVGAFAWHRAAAATAPAGRPLDSSSRVEGDRRRRQAVVLAAGVTALVLTAASAVGLWWLYDPAAPERAYMGTDTKIFEPLVGAVAAALMTRARVQRVVVRHHVGLMVAGLVGLGVGVATLGGPAPAYFAGGAVAFSIACAVLVAAATAGGNGDVVARTLGLAPLAYLGRISYGIYLWHWPLTVWLAPETGFDVLRAALVATGAVLLASLSYHLVEVPVRTGVLTRLAPIRLLPVAAGSIASVLVLSTFLGGTAVSRLNPLSGSLPAAAAERSTVLVVGDSVARRLTPALSEAGTARGLTVVEAARGGCPALTVPALGSDGRLLADGACADQVRATQDAAVTTYDPGIVLWWSRYELADRLGDDGRVLRAGTPEFWAAQRASFLADSARLTSRGATLVVVLTDRPGVGLASRCTPGRCDPFLHRLWFEDDLRRRWNDLVTEVAARDARIRVVGIDDVYCRDAAVPCDDRLPTGPPVPAPETPQVHPTLPAPVTTLLARPDGSHFSPAAAPAVAGPLLDRAAAAARR
ncbi:acyltransferase family protein [Mobilicoccus pelagius]|uniref:Putative acyltransferase n=1 Tax=Mobilicoccus pelagius NBRC 104925 TaxID=1089455 RepID=H5UQ52_9MICO|nr:acyltransferase family protein [Mobilicoccus pelagius]GAB47857.1 putative acyltransferase [Mobilicoccus pelagius NBRC 104925]